MHGTEEERRGAKRIWMYNLSGLSLLCRGEPAAAREVAAEGEVVIKSRELVLNRGFGIWKKSV